MTIRWTDPAVEDLEAVYDYVAHNSAEQAAWVVNELLHVIEVLERFPQMGQADAASPGRRILTHPPYRIYYRVQHDAVEILSILHSARRHNK